MVKFTVLINVMPPPFVDHEQHLVKFESEIVKLILLFTVA